MLIDETIPNEWYVAFAKNTSPLHWWQNIALSNHSDHFRHVTLFKPVTQTHLIIIDPSPTRFKVELRELEVSVEQRMKNLSSCFPIVHLWHKPCQEINYTFYLPTCVTMVKYAMGFNSKAVTPYGFYRDLIKAGALDLSN